MADWSNGFANEETRGAKSSAVRGAGKAAGAELRERTR